MSMEFFMSNFSPSSGPYVLGAGVLTFLLSKEIWVIEHSFTEFVSFWIAVGIITKKFGPKIGAYLDNMTDVSSLIYLFTNQSPKSR